jgi:hypothetical protein
MEPFPVDGRRAANNRNVAVRIEVCGMRGEVLDQQLWNQMIACDNCNIWYHCKSENVPDELFV